MEKKVQKPLKDKISITIDGETLKSMKIFSDEEDRSLSQYINVVLKEHVKKRMAESENQ